MKTMLCLLLTTLAASAQMMRPDWDADRAIQELEVVVVVKLLTRDPEVATNAAPPKVTLEILETLKGESPTGQVAAVWRPHPLYLLCGVGAEEERERWGMRSLQAPEPGSKLLVGLKKTDAGWDVSPDLMEEYSGAAVAQVKLALQDPEKAREARFEKMVIDQLRNRRDTSVQIESSFGRIKLRHLDLMDHVVEVELCNVKISDEDLKRLASLPNLERVRLVTVDGDAAEIDRVAAVLPLRVIHGYASGSAFSDEACWTAGRVKGLEMLILPGSAKLSAEGARHLAASTTLRTIYAGQLLPGAAAGLKALPSLEDLRMVMAEKLTAADAKAFAEMPKLKSLSLDFSRTEPGALPLLASSASLESLEIKCPGDDQLAELATLTNLKHLSIYHPQPRDPKALLKLEKLPGLESLYVATHAIDAKLLEVVEKLRKSLPGCTIR